MIKVYHRKLSDFLPSVIILTLLFVSIAYQRYYFTTKNLVPDSVNVLEVQTPTPPGNSTVVVPSSTFYVYQEPCTLFDGDVPQSVTNPPGWKTHVDENYGYSVKYPSVWVLKNGIDSEGDPNIVLKKNSSLKSKFSNRDLPELYITVHSPYSTSGGVCANQYCEDSYQLSTVINNYECSVTVTEGSVDRNGNKQFDFYSSYIPLPKEDNKYWLQAYFSYRTKEEGEEIARILSTLSY